MSEEPEVQADAADANLESAIDDAQDAVSVQSQALEELSSYLLLGGACLVIGIYIATKRRENNSES